MSNFYFFICCFKRWGPNPCSLWPYKWNLTLGCYFLCTLVKCPREYKWSLLQNKKYSVSLLILSAIEFSVTLSICQLFPARVVGHYNLMCHPLCLCNGNFSCCPLSSSIHIKWLFERSHFMAKSLSAPELHPLGGG